MNQDPINPDADSASKDVEITEFIDDGIISKLDLLKHSKDIYKKYSEIYKGGVYALRNQFRTENPDWMSQSANSFREIFYILNNKDTDNLEQILNSYLKKSLTQEEVNRYRGYLTDLYIFFTDIAHHFSKVENMETRVYTINESITLKAKDLTDKDYLNAVKLLKEYLKILVVSAIDIHAKIDDCAKNNKQDRELVTVLINSSEDGKRYFFSTIDKTWLKWLWTNGFFTILKEKAEDLKKISYRKPELEYLVKMATDDPDTVVSIINSINISEENLNPEVIDRFFWIIESLPASNIKQVLPKVLKENWPKLMTGFNRSGYEYTRATEALMAVKDYESLVTLAQIILTVRNKSDFDNLERFSSSDNFFYLRDIARTNIFDAIADTSNPIKEESLKAFSEALKNVVDLGKDTESSFEKPQPFYTYDIDIFTLNLQSAKRTHFREDIQDFIATIKELVDGIFLQLSEDESEATRIYSKYIATLPDSITCWKLKLYTMTRLPQYFKNEIKDALFRIFTVGDRYSEIEVGAEYHQTLIAGFGSLDEPIQREYIKNVLTYFSATLEDMDKEVWRKQAGLEIIYYIKTYLKPEEILEAEERLGKIPADGNLVPHSSIGESRGGTVSPKAHVNLADFSVEEIIEHIKSDWSPSVLNEQFKNDDFLRPRGVEGLNDALKEDTKTRLGDYLSNINGFFDRENITPSYPYSILREIDEMLRNQKYLTSEQYQLLLNFFYLIQKSGESSKFEKDRKETWFPDWITLNKMIADVLLLMLGDMKNSDLFKSNRDNILNLVRYLLTIDSSPDADDEKSEERDSAGVAINSVRGQAYRAFVQFTYNEGDTFLADDVKVLYEHILDTDFSNAVRFTIGQFLASFYFRDTAYIQGLMSKIFPKDGSEELDQKLFFATWEGYLASSLYKELFAELEPYYEYAVKINPDDYPERKYLKGLDEALAVHLALAFAHYDFKIGDSLFNLFWETKNETRHYEFVSFIGRSCLTRSQAGDEWLKENNVSKEKLVEFWDWMLAQDFEPKAYSGFGLWINPDIEVVEEKQIVDRLPKTLEKSDGDLDWDYGFTQKLEKFAELNPRNTLRAIELYLLTQDGSLNPHRGVPMFSVDNEIKDALAICYKNPETKQDTENLVAKLIDKGSNIFWGLKDALK